MSETLRKKWLMWGRLKQKVRVLNRHIIRANVFLGDIFVATPDVMSVYKIYMMKRVMVKPQPVYIGIESDGTKAFPVFVTLVKPEPPEVFYRIKIDREETAVFALTVEDYNFYEEELDRIKDIFVKVVRATRHPRAWAIISSIEREWERIHR